MSKKVSFVLNIPGGAQVLQEMARPAINTAAERIAQRANTISPTWRDKPQTFVTTETGIGVPNSRGGVRYYAKVQGINSTGGQATEDDRFTLQLARDAGKMNRLV